MTDEVRGKLSALLALRVIARSSSNEYRHTNKSPQQIARELGAEYLLTGTVRWEKHPDGTSRVRVSPELVRVEPGPAPTTKWQQGFDAALTDVFQVQADISGQVAQALHVALGNSAKRELAAKLTQILPAYDHFLRGNYRLANRTPSSVVEAVREYEAAIALDSTFTEALARTAYAYLLLVDWGWPYPGATRNQLMHRAGAVTQRALRQDPGSPGAWLTRAYLLTQRDPYRLSGALDAFEQSLARDSTNAEAFHQYGQSLMILGRDEEALAAYHRALALEPDRPMTLVPIAAINWKKGKLPEASRWADSAVAIAQRVSAPYAWAVRGLVRLDLGDVDRAQRDAERSLEADSSYPVPARSVLARALFREGDTARARAQVNRALGEVKRPDPSPTDARFLGSALMELGRDAEAFDLIERARPRGALLWFYLNGPDFRRVREHPRFANVQQEADPRDRT